MPGMGGMNVTVFGVFLMGLLGGLHCAGMCGGVVTALGMNGRPADTRPLCLQSSKSRRRRCMRMVLYNLGRLAMYGSLGAVAGYAGSLGGWIRSAAVVQQLAYGASQCVLILMAFHLAGWRAPGVWMERLGHRIWLPVQPLAQRSLRHSSVASALFTGAVWGLVPCGMVYGALSLALLSGGPWEGAVLLLAFGLGTLPNLLLLGVSSIWLARNTQKPLVRRAAAGLLGALGVFGLWHLSVAGMHA